MAPNHFNSTHINYSYAVWKLCLPLYFYKFKEPHVNLQGKWIVLHTDGTQKIASSEKVAGIIWVGQRVKIFISLLSAWLAEKTLKF